MQKNLTHTRQTYSYDYALIFGSVFYESIHKTAWETPQGYRPYFNGDGIRFPIQFLHRVREAKAHYVRDLLSGKLMSPVSLVQLVGALYERSLRNGGATLFPYTALPVGRGYVVGRPDEAVQIPILGKTLLLDFLREKAPVLAAQPYLCIGSWYQRETDTWHVCLCDVFFNPQQACVVARGRGVLAYYDLEDARSIVLTKPA